MMKIGVLILKIEIRQFVQIEIDSGHFSINCKLNWNYDYNYVHNRLI
jgi:hypothetical protein